MPSLLGELDRAIDAGDANGDFTYAVELIRNNHNNYEAINNGQFLYRAIDNQNATLLVALLEVPHIDFLITRGEQTALFALQSSDWRFGNALVHQVQNLGRTIDDLVSSNWEFANELAEARRGTPPAISSIDDLDEFAARNNFSSDNDDDNAHVLQNNAAAQSTTTQVAVEPPERVRPSDFLKAASTGDLETVERYLTEMHNMKQAVNIREPRTGNTALILAAASGHTDVVDCLLNADADFMLSNSEGHNAAYLAQENNHDDLAVRIGSLMEDLEKQRKDAASSSGNSSQATGSSSSSSSSHTFSDRIAQINQEDAVPDYFKCPFTREILNNPIAIKGELFDKDYLNSWFSQQLDYATLRSAKGQIITKADINTPICIPIKDAIEAYVKEQEAIHTPKSSANAMKEKFEKIKAEAHAESDEQQPKGPSK